MRVRAFKDPKTLETLLILRRKGFTYKALASIFNVDHSTIYFHCKNIHPETTISFDASELINLNNVDPVEVLKLFPIEVRRIKSYTDYILQYKNKTKFRLISKL